MVYALVAFGLFLLWAWWHNRRRDAQEALVADLKAAGEEHLRNQHALYKLSLEEVKEDPTNPAMQQEALRIGRLYALSTHQAYGKPLLTEEQIANDLAAATAGAVKAAPPDRKSVDERLRLLGQLLATGRITQAEHDARRTAILNSI